MDDKKQPAENASEPSPSVAAGLQSLMYSKPAQKPTHGKSIPKGMIELVYDNGSGPITMLVPWRDEELWPEYFD